ncbi:hypothetical protein SAMN05216312_11641 [Cohnella sp. OV330]|nr:hypothetical protein SAMN05216312_11641 [Cohnella sp. OV330]
MNEGVFLLTADEKKYYTGTWTTAAQAMANMIHYTDKKLDLVDIMGYSGLAFMINIHEETVDITGPTASFDWGSTFARGMNNLGFKCKYVGTITSPPVAPTLEEIEAGLALAQKSIDRGIPVMAWDLFVPEFGVIYGYDDDAQTLRCKDVVKDDDLPYTKLGHGQIGELFVFGIESSFEANKNDSLRDALEMIIDHARVPITRLDGKPFRNGIAGYHAWRKAFEAQTVEDLGNSYNSGVVSDAREYAAEFLRRVSADWKEVPVFGSELSELSLAASEHYQKAADALVKMREMFPMWQGGEPNKPEHAEIAISLLETAQVEEEQGVQKLEQMLAIMEVSSGQMIKKR